MTTKTGHNLADKQALRKDYVTPERILGPVRAYFGGQIPLDPATATDNPTGAHVFFTVADDGLVQAWGEPDQPPDQPPVPWASWGVFVNPPFGDAIRSFLKKISAEAWAGTPIIALLPVNRFEQAYLHEATLAHSPMVCFVTERVHFLDPVTREPLKSNTYPTMVLGYNVDEARFVGAFSELGSVVRITSHAATTQAQVRERQAARRRAKTAERKAVRAAPGAHQQVPKDPPARLGEGKSSRGIGSVLDAALDGFE